MMEVENFTKDNESALEILNEIDEIEKKYVEEFDLIYEKDLADNKDLNVKAIE